MPVDPSLSAPFCPRQRIVRVKVPLPIGDAFDYLVPQDAALPENGAFMEVPFGKQRQVGVVWNALEDGQTLAQAEKLKPVGSLLPIPPMPPATRAFIDWVARYTVTPPGLVLKMAMGGRLRLEKPGDDLCCTDPDPMAQTPELTKEQANAAQELRALVQNLGFSATLLDGVTGSGKTEVYSEAIAQALRQRRQVLVLLPEIAMTAALIERLTARFGARPVEWHSELTEKQRRMNWNAIAQGKARFVLGARSALFLPYPHLGLIVVDEEHEAAYKQEEGVIYHGRDMAVVRAHLENIPIVLASATPSLETLRNVQTKKYRHVILRHRYGRAVLPRIELIDLRQETLPAQTFISDPLMEALRKTVSEEQQAMLFLNRRGYAPLTLCRTCGHRLKCPHCTSWLIEHKQIKRLRCHHCGFTAAIPQACPACQARDSLAACGPGIERIAEEVSQRLPDIRFAIMASDTLSGPKAAQALVGQMNDRSLDLLIGTQIMAKGYHFPRLTLVGVIDADLGLGGGDPRASERTFQLLQQMAGRSGRAEHEGQVLLQTTDPEHPVMQALVCGDRDAFMRAEMNERASYRLPPFTKLASLTVSGPNAPQVIEFARKIAAAAPADDRVRLLGPAPAPFAVLRGQTRYRLLVQAHRSVVLPDLVRNWLNAVPLPKAVRILIDIDPHSFL